MAGWRRRLPFIFLLPPAPSLVHLQASNKKQQNISTHQRTTSLNCKLERVNIPKRESNKATVDKSIEEKLCFHSVSHLHCCSYGNSVWECPSLDPWPPTQLGTGEVGGRGRLPGTREGGTASWEDGSVEGGGKMGRLVGFTMWKRRQRRDGQKS